jgi:Phage integrase, N-terminal SAM-like domain
MARSGPEDPKHPTGELTNSESTLVPRGESALPVPTLVSAAGEEASRHFLNFFLATINRNTRRAYGRQVGVFLRFLEERRLSDIRQIRIEHLAAYIEYLMRGEGGLKCQAVTFLDPDVFDYLVVKQVMAINPTSAVSSPLQMAMRPAGNRLQAVSLGFGVVPPVEMRET